MAFHTFEQPSEKRRQGEREDGGNCDCGQDCPEKKRVPLP